MRLKKILVTASTFPRWKNDTESRFVYDLSQHLSKQYDITVLAPHHHNAKTHELMEGLKIVRFKYFFSSQQKLCYEGGIHENLKKSFLAKLQVPFFLLSEFVHTLALINKQKPSIVHAHWILPQGLVAAFIKKFFNRKFKLIVTSHAGDVFILNNPFLRFFARFTLKNSHAVTSNSSFTASAVKKVFNKPVSIIPMGVDLDKFRKSASSIRKKYSKPIILFVGRLAEKKGVHHLISAMPSVVASFPTAKLLIIGSGPEKNSLVSLANRLQLQKNISFLDSIPNSELPKYYSSADVFVLPSIVARSGDTEGLGVVLLEALASGLPAIASDVGGIPDVIINKKTGLLVAQKSTVSLATAILNLLNNKKLQKTLIKNGKRHINNNFSWKVVSKKFSDVYERV